MSVKGTQTEKQLLAAFAGESQARGRYHLFAEKAREEGFFQIAELFEETGRNEYEHAKRFFSYLEGGMVEITAMYPAGEVGSTEENLKEAAAGENEEHTLLYPEGARIAKEEGFPEIAAQFSMIARVEEEHEKRYLKLLDNLQRNRVFKRDEKVKWKCILCGYIHEGYEPPAQCPSCKNPKEQFALHCEAY